MSAQPEDQVLVPVDRAEIVHQVLRREVNERISALPRKRANPEAAEVNVCCECVRGSCVGRVVLTVAEYEAIRRFPTRFVVKEGHEVAGGERIVGEGAGYVVVEKGGPEGLYAVGTDPRRRSLRRLRPTA